MMIPAGVVLALWVTTVSGDYADDNCLSNGSGSANVTASDGAVLPVYFKCKGEFAMFILGCALASAKDRLIGRYDVGAVSTGDGVIYMLSCFSTKEPRLDAGITEFCEDELKAGFDKTDTGSKASISDAAIKKHITADVPLDKDNNIAVVYSVACSSNSASVEKCTIPSGSRFKHSTEISIGSMGTIVKDGVDWVMTCNKYTPASAVKSPQDYASGPCADDVAAAWRKVVEQAVYPTPQEVEATKRIRVEVQVSNTNDKASVFYTFACLSNPKPRLVRCTYDKGSRIKDRVTVQAGDIAYILHEGTEYELFCHKATPPSIDDKRVTAADKLCEDKIKKEAKKREIKKQKESAKKDDGVITKTVFIDRPTIAKKLKAPVELTIACFGAYPRIKTCKQRFKLGPDESQLIGANQEGPCVDVGFVQTTMTRMQCNALSNPKLLSPEETNCKS